MKKIMLSLAVIAIVAVGAIGATRAYFSDTATVGGNTFTSGSMNLRIDEATAGSTFSWTDGFTSGQTIGGLYPGFPAAGEPNAQVIDLRNTGNVGGFATLDMTRSTVYNELSSNLKFDVYYSIHDADTAGTFANAIISGKTLSEIISDGPISLGALPANDSAANAGKIASVKIVWSVPTIAGNEIMGDSATIDAVFGLTQGQ